MKFRYTLLIQLLPIYVLVFGLVSYGFLTARTSILKQKDTLEKFTTSTEAKQEIKTESSQTFSGRPVRVIIPSVNINVAIEEGNYFKETKSWNVSKTSAHFANQTSLPNNQENNTLIYGHNSTNIFGKTKDLKQGDKLYLETDNNLVFEYQYTDQLKTKPTDISVFAYQGPPRLTLLTCTGFLNKERMFMFFEFLSVKQI